MSAYVLDTTVLIDHAEGFAPAADMLETLFGEAGDLYTCDVVTCETLSRGDEHAIAIKRTLLDALEYVALDPEGAAWAGEQRRLRREAGRRPPSTTDALIAALAHRLGATVVTRNAKDYEPFDVPLLGYGEVSVE